MDRFYYIVVLLLGCSSALTSPVFPGEDLTDCSKLSCHHDEYCIRGASEVRCSKELQCDTTVSNCPVEGTVCKLLQLPCPFPQCPYIETCQYSCDGITCNAGEVCRQEGDSPPFCVDKVCHDTVCETDLKCVAIREPCQLLNLADCPLVPKCIHPADACQNYECEEGFRCVASRDHCISPECISHPKCEHDYCFNVECEDDYMCVEFGPNCEVGTEVCLSRGECVRKDSPCDLYVCGEGTICQESRNHCTDRDSHCQPLPQCVNRDDPCLNYQCDSGYHCREDTTHCGPSELICHPWAVCEKHVRTCEDTQCKENTECEMQEGDCEGNHEPCPLVPICVPVRKRGKSLATALKTLKLAKESKFEKILYKGALGFFITEKAILEFLEGLKDKKEIKKDIIEDIVSSVAEGIKEKKEEKKEKKKKKFESLITDDAEIAIGMLLFPSKKEEIMKPFKTKKPLLKPIKSHKPFMATPTGTSIYYKKGFRPLKKPSSSSSFHQRPRPILSNGHPRPIYYKRPEMNVFIPRYGQTVSGRSNADQEYTTGNGTETGSNNSTEVIVDEAGDVLEEYESIISVQPMTDGTKVTGVGGVEYEYETLCGEEGVRLNLRTMKPFSGNVSYLTDTQICNTHRIDNETNISVNLPYDSGCGEGASSFSLRHFIQIDWESGHQEVIPVECQLESRGRLETKVTIDPEKTKSVKDLKGEIQQFLLLFGKNGEPITGNVRLGETVQLYYTVGMTLEHTFDVDVMNCWATAEKGDYKEQIVKDSCPMNPEKIKGPNKKYIPNRLDKWNTYDIIYVIKTHPINGSLNVKYSCDVRVCMPKCTKKIRCGNKKREEEETDDESRTAYMQVGSV